MIRIAVCDDEVIFVRCLRDMVEATRIELVSENKSTQLSTSVVYLH